MATLMTDAAIKRLGMPLLQELHAIAAFCDSTGDGKLAIIPSSHRRNYEPGGELGDLVKAGCVRLLKSTHCATINMTRPALRMEQFGRQVLRRAEALQLDLDPPTDDLTE